MYLLLDVPFVFIVVVFVVAGSVLLLLTLARLVMFDVVLMPKLNAGADDAGLLAVNDVNPENPLKAEGAV